MFAIGWLVLLLHSDDRTLQTAPVYREGGARSGSLDEVIVRFAERDKKNMLSRGKGVHRVQREPPCATDRPFKILLVRRGSHPVLRPSVVWNLLFSSCASASPVPTAQCRVRGSFVVKFFLCKWVRKEADACALSAVRLRPPFVKF